VPLVFSGMCELTLSTDNVKRVSLQNLECMKRITWNFREKSLLLVDFKYIYFLSRWIYLKIEIRCSEIRKHVPIEVMIL